MSAQFSDRWILPLSMFCLVRWATLDISGTRKIFSLIAKFLFSFVIEPVSFNAAVAAVRVFRFDRLTRLPSARLRPPPRRASAKIAWAMPGALLHRDGYKASDLGIASYLKSTLSTWMDMISRDLLKREQSSFPRNSGVFR